MRRSLSEKSYVCTFTLLAAFAAAAFAQAPAKKVVKSEADLPRFNYAIPGTATQLLTSDDATFNAFAAKVRADVDSVLNGYEITDHAALRDLLEVQLNLDLLANDDKAALETADKIRELEDKPDAKLMSGLAVRAMLEARRATGQSSGPAYEKAYATDYAASLKPLPWAVVGNRIKEAKSQAEIISPSLVLGSVQAQMEPAVAKTHQLSNDLAWELIGARLEIKQVLPLRAQTVAVLSQDVAANNVEKPDIWAARDVTLTEADKLTPVRVAIWDSGSDLSLFPGRVYTDPHPGPNGDPPSLKLPNLLAVGAVDQAGDEASFTSYGDTVLVDANGYQVESVLPGGKKVRFSGTSMASPNVVNLAAKLIALDPKLTPEETIHLIVAGATASPDGRRHNIDPKRSVELLQRVASVK